jgi:hypothetical protein
MFAALPVDFPKLERVLVALGAVAVTNPPEIEAIGRRLRTLFQRAREDGYRSVAASDFRRLPYAYWLAPEPPLPEIHEALVLRYWEEALPAALSSGPRRARRWLMPLFFTYCEAFNERDPHFIRFANRLSGHLRDADGDLAERLRGLQQEISIFAPATAAARIGFALLGYEGTLDRALESMLLWPGFVDTRLGDAALEAVLDSGDARLAEWPFVARLMDWVKRLAAPVSKGPHRIAFANALLEPWSKRRPTDVMRARLVEFLVHWYGDPRMEGPRRYQWNGVSADALAVIMTWLAGDTLRGFMKVLERTADEIWRYREKFWMAFYDAGYVQEAWLALGWDAAQLAKRLQSDARGIGYGRLDGGAAADQSVLLLKIGDLVFTEWSHNGSLRAYRDNDPRAPVLYLAKYQGNSLRASESMDFHGGLNANPELRHMNSQGGTWQRKARDFIRRHTGIHLEDRRIL